MILFDAVFRHHTLIRKKETRMSNHTAAQFAAKRVNTQYISAERAAEIISKKGIAVLVRSRRIHPPGFPALDRF